MSTFLISKIERLKKYKIKDCKIENNKIVIDQNVELYNIAPEDMGDLFNGVIFEGYVVLRGFSKISSKNFLGNCIIKSNLQMDETRIVHEQFLTNTVVEGVLDLYSLMYASKNFLKYTTIKRKIYMESLRHVHKDFIDKYGSQIICHNILVGNDTTFEILKYNNQI